MEMCLIIAPQSSRWDWPDKEIASVWRELGTAQRFRKNVDHLILSRDMSKIDSTTSNLLTNKVNIYFDVLSVMVEEHWVFSNVESTFIVTV